MNGYLVVKEADSAVMCICGEQSYNSTQKYRMSDFVVSQKMSDGTLFLSCLTGEIVKVFDYNKSFQYLVMHWFLILNETDEKSLVPKLRKLLNAFEQTRERKLKYFEIVTTTYCNANCFYCYEKGYNISSMNSITAKKVVEFIKNNNSDSSIKIQWYGGEPLMNSNSIDIICDGLKQHNIDFESSIISNGLLFNDNIIHKANILWNLKMARISLDGNEDIYNKVKSYKNISENPFCRVLLNIDKLLNANIHVGLRINIEYYNFESCLSLINNLATKYKGNELISFNINLLNNTQRNDKIESNKEKRYPLFKEIVKIKERLFREGFNVNFISIPNMSTVFCPADDRSHILIRPNGDLAFCAENFDNIAESNIFSNHNDIHIPKMFYDTYQKNDTCNDCPMYASCTLSKLCPSCKPPCTPEIKEIKIYELKLSMEKLYHNYIKTNM